ncbi:YfjZ family antitoxin protein [Yokenella regensburgei ATCC 49455]|uniref:Antitoxin YeeU n=1 Tax=Yokenella regensburgei TaxID=158877 RepID=A0AB38FV95_9ENTR|nr:YfjZ family antitoxin protein [Yokenella regensburgei ATCC 49455]SQA62931.1 Antitoxin YeeU [Yokenella regensburgei]SQB02174.1 Antitoxin YeeU [Yokenella regensburgei]SUQ07524.1 Antitoxin YeeU [Yokenella regensburgei]
MTPCFDARLVQEGNRLHYLADCASITGTFSDADLHHLDQAFPLLLKQLELMLLSGELNPRHQHSVTLYAKGLSCEADKELVHQVADGGLRIEGRDNDADVNFKLHTGLRFPLAVIFLTPDGDNVFFPDFLVDIK